ncbi:hypothetical protein MTO96_011112 [Rhipicephalus appendiculatus]
MTKATHGTQGNAKSPAILRVLVDQLVLRVPHGIHRYTRRLIRQGEVNCARESRLEKKHAPTRRTALSVIVFRERARGPCDRQEKRLKQQRRPTIFASLSSRPRTDGPSPLRGPRESDWQRPGARAAL